MTVNIALSLQARVRIETRDDDRIILESRDRGVRVETTIERMDELANDEQIEMVSKMVNFFRPEIGFHLVAESEAPAGAGISGSSALAIALIGGLNRMVGNRYDARKFITIAANIESTVIKVPAGFQDYYPAFYGSTSCIHFRPDGIEREHLRIDEAELERRFVICYTGEPRNSGINNWEIFKRHIDGDAELFEIFERIREAAKQMRAALLANDWNSVAETMRAAYPTSQPRKSGCRWPIGLVRSLSPLASSLFLSQPSGRRFCHFGNYPAFGWLAFSCNWRSEPGRSGVTKPPTLPPHMSLSAPRCSAWVLRSVHSV